MNFVVIDNNGIVSSFVYDLEVLENWVIDLQNNFLYDCVVEITLSGVSRKLLAINGAGNIISEVDIWGQNRYTHYYVLKPNSQWNDFGVSFKLNTSSSSSFTPDGFLNYLSLSPFKTDDASSFSSFSKVFPVFGVVSVNNGVPVVCKGIFLYDDGVDKFLKYKANYATYGNLDVNTLVCTGIFDNAKSSWVVFGIKKLIYALDLI